MANPTKRPHGGPPDQHGDEGRNDRGEHNQPGDNPQVSFERKDINIFQISGFGIGLLIAFMVTVVAMYGLFAWLAKESDKQDPTNAPAMLSEKLEKPMGRGLQEDPVKELQQM